MAARRPVPRSDATCVVEDLDASVTTKQSWADTHGVGERAGFLGTTGWVGEAINMTGTLFLLLASPLATVYSYQINKELDGSISGFGKYVAETGVQGAIDLIPRPNLLAWQQFGTFAALQTALMLLVPCKTFAGPVTPHGNSPVYNANGVQSYLLTLLIFFGAWSAGWIDPGLVYENFGPLLSVCNLAAFALLAFLYFKGIVAPSSSDSGSTGNFLYDIFWGTELHPAIGQRFYIKQWTNCRMGMMGWAVLTLCFAIRQYQVHGYVADSMVVSVLLMQVYCFKFFLWETGYLASMDITHDRAGFMICWGCLAWVPSIYTAPAQYLVGHPEQLGHALAAAIFAAGLACVYINYDADRQRQVFRATNGKTPIWGAPPKMIRAAYVTAKGETRQSLLLASGWWGVARHFHYVPEIMGAFFWTVPAGFKQVQPYFYVFFLTILLCDRALRDDDRCNSKYGSYWAQYRKLVPYKMVPGIY